MLEKYAIQRLDSIATAEQLIQLIDAGQLQIEPLSLWGERSEGGEAGWGEGASLIARKKMDLIEDVLQDFGSQADWQTLRDALPPLVADHEIRLVRAGW